jgi:hypothetical protein
MVELFRRSVAILFAGVVGFTGVASAQPGPSGDPPGRVGRLAFIQGTVSFHDRDQSDWAPAVANRPLTSGDAIWTEPSARSEISISGTRVRMESATQLDMLMIDDSQTRMQIDRGRLDIKTFTYDTRQPYEILTPRGTISIQQQGDYYVEAGSTEDPTRIGVRVGAAQFQTSDGRVLAVRAGEVGEISGDGDTIQLLTVRTPPPAMPTYWAERDRIVVYDQPPQYLSAGMTGYEDMNYYGSWSNDPEYGQVWAPRAVVAGWEPYRTGQWSYVQPWGWTWVDEQPWGFAPYHYGRWANRNNRWVWVPPQRDLRPVYAPALVAFVGGVELGVAIGQQSRAPVGWFPLGPREAYVPPYSNDRDYYRRLNASARVQDQVMEQNWQRAQRREAVPANQQQTAFMNRRFATVVPAEDFAHSRPVARVALQVAPEKLTAAPVAPVAAPPAPTQSIRAVQAPATGAAPGTQPGTRPTDPNARPPQGQAAANAQANVPTTETRLSNMQAIGRPSPTTADRPKAPGPQIATTRPSEPTPAPSATAPNATRPGLPALAPRTGAAPPQLQGERTPAPGQPGQPPKPGDNRATTTAPPPAAGQPAQPAQPGTTPKPADNRAVTTPPPTGAQPPAGQPGQPRPPGQANLPPVQPPNANRPVEPPKPGEPPKPQQAQQPAAPAQPPRQAEPPKPQGAVTPQPQRPAEPPKPQQAQQPAPQPPHQAEPPKPQGAVTPPPQPQRQATPAPQPQAPPPPAQVHAPTPPPQAAPPAQAHVPAPPPQPQAHVPAPPPPQAAHPAPAPQPPQQAHAPAPAPQPPQQAHAPAPQPPQKKDEEKK